MEVPGVHPGRVVAFGVFNEEAGTEDCGYRGRGRYEDAAEREQIAEAIRQSITRRFGGALRTVHLVGPQWMIKTSSGKNARLANRDSIWPRRVKPPESRAVCATRLEAPGDTGATRPLSISIVDKNTALR